MPIRVFVVGDIRFYREGLAHRIGVEDACVVVGTAPRPSGALPALGDASVDVVLVDAASSGGLEEVRGLAAAHPDTPIVALGVPETERDVIACAEAGVAGYVPRDAGVAELLRTVAQVRDGETPIPPRIANHLFRRLAALSAGGMPAPTGSLTPREAEILELIDQGLSNKEIGRRLHIELPTVKNHVHHILEKLQVSRRGEAAARAGGRR